MNRIEFLRKEVMKTQRMISRIEGKLNKLTSTDGCSSTRDNPIKLTKQSELNFLSTLTHSCNVITGEFFDYHAIINRIPRHVSFTTGYQSSEGGEAHYLIHFLEDYNIKSLKLNYDNNYFEYNET